MIQLASAQVHASERPGIPIRVFYSFPHRLGSGRICYTAWQQVSGLASAGAEVTAAVGSIVKPLAGSVRVHTTLSRGAIRIPYRVVGHKNAFWIHDVITAKLLKSIAGSIDIVHAWPLGSRQTLKTARALGIPAVLERPNAHTRFAMEVVRRECQKMGVALPAGHEHAYDEDTIHVEEEEYELATALLCPSDFVLRTFLEKGFERQRLVRHQYGFDERVFCVSDRSRARSNGAGLNMLFVGGCAPRKGLHYALSAWLASSACEQGRFVIAGEFVPGYREALSSMLSHSSIVVLGQRNDVADLMRQADVLVLPSIEEGSALVTSEARGCGCVLLVSEASGAMCRHMHDSLVHEVGDVSALAEHMGRLDRDRSLLERLRVASLESIGDITWTAAARRLVEAYGEVLSDVKRGKYAGSVTDSNEDPTEILR